MENYVLYGEIGASAVKTVYKGRRRGTIRFQALHKWHKSQKQLVANEVCLLLSLHHTNILAFSEWYETAQHIWVITELASGGTLADILIQDGRLPLHTLCPFLRDIAAGLRYLHEQDVVYFDLQPHKISLDSYLSLKLSDFTLAHRANQTPPLPSSLLLPLLKRSFYTHLPPYSSSLPPPPSCPSPFYMAPEGLQGKRLTMNSDLWSLGCIAYELATAGDHVSEVTKVTALLRGLLQRRPSERLSWQQISPVLLESGM